MMVKEHFTLQKGKDSMLSDKAAVHTDAFEVEKNEDFNIHDYTLAKNVAEHLEKKYPGWLWAVHVMDGVVGVKSMRLSGNWGFILHEEKIDKNYKVVTNAGGEILERFRQQRGQFNNTLYNDLKMDDKGKLNGEYH
tara:strand:+ start:174 stop:581 length:408 start_codon:yes stop_codon:yes gene_type:complete